MTPRFSFVLSMFVGILLVAVGGCSSPDPAPPPPETTERVVERYPDSTRKVVEVRAGDSLVERRVYRTTGSLRRVERGDSVATYLDLHDPDSAAVLGDLLQGRWRNTSADPSSGSSSAYYIFQNNTLTFENPSGDPIESIDVEYRDYRTIITPGGMPAEATVTSFDTVEVTGYTLVREEE